MLTENLSKEGILGLTLKVTDLTNERAQSQSAFKIKNFEIGFLRMESAICWNSKHAALYQ